MTAEEIPDDPDPIKFLPPGIEAMEPLLKHVESVQASLPAFPDDRYLQDVQKIAASQFALVNRISASFPPLQTAQWYPKLNLIDPSIFKTLANSPAFGISHALTGFSFRFFELYRPQWDGIFKALRDLTITALPPNWKGTKQPGMAAIEAILLDEGIPLAWVPGLDILQAVFDAPDARARRAFIGKRWKTLVSQCATCLTEVNHPELRAYGPFASSVVRALDDGHPEAAQALAANLLDSILRRNFERNELRIVTTNRKGGNRFDLNEHDIRAAFTLAPIWRAYAEYWQDNGDPVPRTFGRHPSAHAVGPVQYSRINAVIGLMLVTSLLSLLNEDLV